MLNRSEENKLTQQKVISDISPHLHNINPHMVVTQFISLSERTVTILEIISNTTLLYTIINTKCNQQLIFTIRNLYFA